MESPSTSPTLSAPGKIDWRISGVRYWVTVGPDLGSSPSAHASVAVNPIAIASTRHHKVALIDFTAIFSCFPGSRKA